MTAVEVDRRVADPSGDAGRAMKELAVEDQSPADAGSDRDADDVRSAARRALPPFADRRAVRVVVEGRRQIQSLADAIAQRKVSPAEVGCDDDDALVAIERAGRANAAAEEGLSGRVGL